MHLAKLADIWVPLHCTALHCALTPCWYRSHAFSPYHTVQLSEWSDVVSRPNLKSTCTQLSFLLLEKLQKQTIVAHAGNNHIRYLQHSINSPHGIHSVEVCVTPCRTLRAQILDLHPPRPHVIIVYTITAILGSQSLGLLNKKVCTHMPFGEIACTPVLKELGPAALVLSSELVSIFVSTIRTFPNASKGSIWSPVSHMLTIEASEYNHHQKDTHPSFPYTKSSNQTHNTTQHSTIQYSAQRIVHTQEWMR